MLPCHETTPCASVCSCVAWLWCCTAAHHPPGGRAWPVPALASVSAATGVGRVCALCCHRLPSHQVGVPLAQLHTVLAHVHVTLCLACGMRRVVLEGCVHGYRLQNHHCRDGHPEHICYTTLCAMLRPTCGTCPPQAEPLQPHQCSGYPGAAAPVPGQLAQAASCLPWGWGRSRALV